MCRPLIALLAACAVLGAGCGAGAHGPQTTLVVTRDFGAAVVSQPKSIDATPGLTAMRQLQGSHETTSSFGGRYINSIDGLKEDNDSSWLVYVDGIETTKGATSVRLKPGQTVQWDFHAWQTIRTGGAIVGAFPQPLKSRGARVICAPERSDACVATRAALKAAGVLATGSSAVRVVVGQWSDIEGFDGVPDLTSSGETNGAFAQFSKNGDRLTPFSADGSEGRVLKAGAGLLAAFSDGTQATWVITGTDEAGAAEAAELLRRPAEIRNRFAVLATGGGMRPLPEGSGE